MDPFSITAGAIGITGFAMISISQLCCLFDCLSEAQDVVGDIASTLTNIKRTLDALEQLCISDELTSVAAKEDLKKTGMVEAVNKSGDACNDFKKNLEKWTKHSTSSTKLSLRDRFSVGIWNKEKIRKFRLQLQSCEATVHFAVSTSQLRVQLHSAEMSQSDRENVQKQLKSLETKIQGHFDLTQREESEAQRRRQDLEEEPEDDEDDGAQRALACREVEEQLRILKEGQVSCRVILTQAHAGWSNQDIGEVLTSDDSTAIVGLTEDVVGKINQRIAGVRTEKGSKAVVGVYKGDFKF